MKTIKNIINSDLFLAVMVYFVFFVVIYFATSKRLPDENKNINTILKRKDSLNVMMHYELKRSQEREEIYRRKLSYFIKKDSVRAVITDSLLNFNLIPYHSLPDSLKFKYLPK